MRNQSFQFLSTCGAMAIKVGGGDARDWDKENYRSSILLDRELHSRTIFRAVFAPTPNPETLAVTSSDGSVAAYPIPSCISPSTQPVQAHKKMDQQYSHDMFLAEPLCLIQGHKGPAYDLKFYVDGMKLYFRVVEMMVTFGVGDGWTH